MTAGSTFSSSYQAVSPASSASLQLRSTNREGVRQATLSSRRQVPLPSSGEARAAAPSASFPKPRRVWHTPLLAREETSSFSDRVVASSVLPPHTVFSPRLDVVLPMGSAASSQPAVRARSAATRPFSPRQQRRRPPSPPAVVGPPGSVVAATAPPEPGPSAAERASAAYWDTVDAAEADAQAARAAEEARHAQAAAEEAEAAWLRDFLTAKVEADARRAQQVLDDEEAAELAILQRERERRAADEALRIELEQRRARTKARAAEVEQMMREQRREAERLREAEQRKAAEARAAAKARKAEAAGGDGRAAAGRGGSRELS